MGEAKQKPPPSESFKARYDPANQAIFLWRGRLLLTGRCGRRGGVRIQAGCQQ
jgi:hypothetical protein